MAKLTLLAVVAATALASTATATTSTTPNPKTCNAAFLNSLTTALALPSSPYGGCFANATASLTAAAGFSGSAATLLTGFVNVDPFSAAQALVASSPLLLGSLNAVWWNAGAGAIGKALGGPTGAPVGCPTNATMSAQAALMTPTSSTPCSTWPQPAWAGVASALNQTYMGLVEAFAYNAIIPTFPLLPPCLPTACQYAVTQTCDGNATVIASAPILSVMSSVFLDINTYATATNALFSGASGTLLGQGIQAQNPTFVTNPSALNCTQFGGWGSSLSAANGGTKGDAASAARVGVLAAAVAVMAAAIAA